MSLRRPPSCPKPAPPARSPVDSPAASAAGSFAAAASTRSAPVCIVHGQQHVRLKLRRLIHKNAVGIPSAQTRSAAPRLQLPARLRELPSPPENPHNPPAHRLPLRACRRLSSASAYRLSSRYACPSARYAAAAASPVCLVCVSRHSRVSRRRPHRGQLLRHRPQLRRSHKCLLDRAPSRDRAAAPSRLAAELASGASLSTSCLLSCFALSAVPCRRGGALLPFCLASATACGRRSLRGCRRLLGRRADGSVCVAYRRNSKSRLSSVRLPATGVKSWQRAEDRSRAHSLTLFRFSATDWLRRITLAVSATRRKWGEPATLRSRRYSGASVTPAGSDLGSSPAVRYTLVRTGFRASIRPLPAAISASNPHGDHPTDCRRKRAAPRRGPG